MTAGATKIGLPSSRAETAVVTSLRARPETMQLRRGDESYLTIRVEMPEVWDTLRLEAAPTSPVLMVKTHALDALYPEGIDPNEFVMKLNGFEVRNEDETLAEAGAIDGSTFLLTFRRRRPIRN